MARAARWAVSASLLAPAAMAAPSGASSPSPPAAVAKRPYERTVSEGERARMFRAQAASKAPEPVATAAASCVVRVRPGTFSRYPAPECNGVVLTADGLVVAPASAVQRVLIADGYYSRERAVLDEVEEAARALDAADSIETRTRLASAVRLARQATRGVLVIQWPDGCAAEAVVLDVDPSRGVAVLAPAGRPLLRLWDGLAALAGVPREKARFAAPSRRAADAATAKHSASSQPAPAAPEAAGGAAESRAARQPTAALAASSPAGSSADGTAAAPPSSATAAAHPPSSAEDVGTAASVTHTAGAVAGAGGSLGAGTVACPAEDVGAWADGLPSPLFGHGWGRVAQRAFSALRRRALDSVLGDAGRSRGPHAPARSATAAPADAAATPAPSSSPSSGAGPAGLDAAEGRRARPWEDPVTRGAAHFRTVGSPANPHVGSEPGGAEATAGAASPIAQSTWELRRGSVLYEVFSGPTSSHDEAVAAGADSALEVAPCAVRGVARSIFAPASGMRQRPRPTGLESVAASLTALGTEPGAENKPGSMAGEGEGPTASVRLRPWDALFFGEGVLDVTPAGTGAVLAAALPLDPEATARVEFALGRRPLPTEALPGGSARHALEAAESNGGGRTDVDLAELERIRRFRDRMPAGWAQRASDGAAALRWTALGWAAAPFPPRRGSSAPELPEASQGSQGRAGGAGGAPSQALVPPVGPGLAALPLVGLFTSDAALPWGDRARLGLGGRAGGVFRGAACPDVREGSRLLGRRGAGLGATSWPVDGPSDAEDAALSDAESLMADADAGRALTPPRAAVEAADASIGEQCALLRVASAAPVGVAGAAVVAADGRLAGMVVRGAPGARDCVAAEELAAAVEAARCELGLRGALPAPDAAAAAAPGPSRGQQGRGLEGRPRPSGLELVVPAAALAVEEWTSGGFASPDRGAAAARPGLVVAAVAAASPAGRAGIRPGACISSVNGAVARQARQLRVAELEAALADEGRLLLGVQQPCVAMVGSASDAPPLRGDVVLDMRA